MARFHSSISIHSFPWSMNNSSDKHGSLSWRSHLHLVRVPTLFVRLSCVVGGARVLHRLLFFLRSSSVSLPFFFFSFLPRGASSHLLSSGAFVRRFGTFPTFRTHVLARTCLDSMFPSKTWLDVSHVHTGWSRVREVVRMEVMCVIRVHHHQGWESVTCLCTIVPSTKTGLEWNANQTNWGRTSPPSDGMEKVGDCKDKKKRGGGGPTCFAWNRSIDHPRRSHGHGKEKSKVSPWDR